MRRAIVWGWEEFVEARDWNGLDDWWRNWREMDLDEDTDEIQAFGVAPLRALLIALRNLVPSITIINGMEQMERHLRPDDPPEKWEGREDLKGAAEILYLGELEAEVKGAPIATSKRWGEYRSNIEGHLRTYLAQGEVTKGDKEFSRAAHAREALELLKSVDVSNSLMGQEMDDYAGREWLTEVIAEVAYAAFEAGRHTQEAWSKEFEQHAVRGEKTISAAKTGGDQRKGKLGEKTLEIIEAMKARIAMGAKITEAARWVHRSGLGSSPEANRSLWYSHEK